MLTGGAARELKSRQAFGTDADYVFGDTDLLLDSKLENVTFAAILTIGGLSDFLQFKLVS